MAFQPRLTGNLEVSHHKIEKLADTDQLGIKHKGGGNILFPGPVEQSVQKGRLACAYFTGKENEALSALNPIGQGRQRFLGGLRQVQVARIRANIERRVLQPKEVFVHTGSDSDTRNNGLGSLLEIRFRKAVAVTGLRRF